ncbi:hypothetical protein EJB05_51841 [Eragrostis curvula]|uniref:Uncharacterized protein n=1 Tax=Eragrostis curvula TaxID=38414 RepID=A0A5J9SUN1_9POAL|nr:hypothetical protein EJB05_51841 [Eragrostis curvula]
MLRVNARKKTSAATAMTAGRGNRDAHGVHSGVAAGRSWMRNCWRSYARCNLKCQDARPKGEKLNEHYGGEPAHYFGDEDVIGNDTVLIATSIIVLNRPKLKSPPAWRCRRDIAGPTSE